MRWALLIVCASCATSLERSSAREFLAAERSRVLPAVDDAPVFSGTLAEYEAYAVANHPGLRAAFEAWRSAALSVSSARELPQPKVSFSYFVRSIETRVGAQRARLGVRQVFPWPSVLSEGANANAYAASAKQRRFDAMVLSVLAAVRVTYWDLWRLRQVRAIHRTHLSLMEGLSATSRARIRTGNTSLADQQQVDLTVSRLRDMIASLDAQESQVVARLGSAIGIIAESLPTTAASPQPRALSTDLARMQRLVARHPLVSKERALASSEAAKARLLEGKRWPQLSAGVDWFVVDGAGVGADDRGKDALSVTVGVSIPLWQGKYGDQERAARARQRRHELRAQALALQKRGDLQAIASQLRDTKRRARLYKQQLIPLAETTYQAALGSYRGKGGNIAQLILAQEAVLTLKVEEQEILAAHQQAWARLHNIVGVVID